MLVIRDGVDGLAAPKRLSHMWRFGPESYRPALGASGQRPIFTLLLAGAEVGLGVWLALKQYEKE